MSHFELKSLIQNSEAELDTLENPAVEPESYSLEWACQTIESHDGIDTVLMNLDKIAGLDKAFALAMIEKDRNSFETVLKNHKFFAGFIPDAVFAEELVRAGYEREVGRNLSVFASVNKKVIKLLLRTDESWRVSSDIEAGRFELLNAEDVIGLIEDGLGWVVCNYEKLFEPEVYNKQVFLAIIAYEKADKYYFDRLDLEHKIIRFVGLDQSVVDALLVVPFLENSVASTIRNSGDSFNGLSVDTAVLIFREGYSGWVINNVSRFVGLCFDNEFAQLLLKNNKDSEVYSLLYQMHLFKGLERGTLYRILRKVIDDRSFHIVHELFSSKDIFKSGVFDKQFFLDFKEVRELFYEADLSLCTQLDKEVAQLFIKYDRRDKVFSNAERFSGLDGEILEGIIIDRLDSRERFLIGSVDISKFGGRKMGNQFAKELLMRFGLEGVYFIKWNHEIFEGLDRSIAEQILKETEDVAFVVNNSALFVDFLVDKKFLYQVLKHRSHYEEDVLKKVIERVKLDKTSAIELIKTGDPHAYSLVVRYVGKFKGLRLDNFFADQLQRMGLHAFVVSHVDSFIDVNPEEIITTAVKSGIDLEELVPVLSKYADLSKNLFLHLLDKIENTLTKYKLISKSESFLGLDEEVLVRIFKEFPRAEVNLEHFSWVQDGVVAQNLLKTGRMETLIKNMHRFPLLDHAEYARRFVLGGNGAVVVKYIKNFSDSEKWFAFNELDLIKEFFAEDVWPIDVTDQDADFIKKNQKDKLRGLSMLEIFLLARNKTLQTTDVRNSDGAREIFELTNEVSFQGEPLLRDQFMKGAETFGYDVMYRYANKNRHDALFAFDRIIELYRASGLSTKDFVRNILFQVADAKGLYNGLTGYQKLNGITENIDKFKKIKTVLAEARTFTGIEQLQKLLAAFNDPLDVFRSWKYLIQYDELEKMLSQRELFLELVQENDHRLRTYVSTLLFHPSISNNTAVHSFWKNPSNFFDSHASHTPEDLHDRKKPSNYFRIPHLSLTAVELRDSIVKGALDKIQVFDPFEVEYVLPDDASFYERMSELPEHDLLAQALGKRSEGTRGNTKDPSRLFIEVQKTLAKYEITIPSIMKREARLPIEVKREIVQLIYASESGYARSTQKYRMKIGRKDDPDMVVAGNDTACCMPFGDGKAALYMCNPNCGQLVLQREVKNSEGEMQYRTVAQSVLTQDRDVGVSIPDLISRMKNGVSDMASILPQEVLLAAKTYVAADSIEVAGNFSDDHSMKIITGLYQDFFNQYFDRKKSQEDIQTSHIVIGDDYGKRFANLPRLSNTFLPHAPMSYTDKGGDSVMNLSLNNADLHVPIIKRTAIEIPRETYEQSKIAIPNVEPLTFNDALQVGYVEGKTYQGMSMKQGGASMMNALIAKDIMNAYRNSPNMSFKFVDEHKEMKGYLLAHEGLMGDKNIIYVSDLAKLPDAPKGVGKQLMDAFLAEYVASYILTKKYTPIMAHAREVTSYKLIVRHLNEYGQKHGLHFVLHELGTSVSDGEPFHQVLIGEEKSMLALTS